MRENPEDFLLRLGNDLPPGRFSVPEVVAGGRRLHRRRTRRTLAAVVAAVVVVSGAGTALAAVRGGNQPTPGPAPAVAPTDVPHAAPGKRFVGIGRAVVQVPASWRNLILCSGGAGVVEIQVPSVGCLFGYTVPAGPSVSLQHYSVGYAAMHVAVPIDGQQVRESALRCSHTSCYQSVAVPAQNVIFGIIGEGIHASQQVAAIRSTLAILPAQFTTQAATKHGVLADAGRVIPVPGLVTDPEQLVGTWTPISAGAQPGSGNPPSVVFTDKTATATGCGRTTADYTLSPTGAFARATSLDFHCSGPAGGTSALEQTAFFTRDPGADELVAHDVDGRVLATYAGTDAAPSKLVPVTSSGQLVGTWQPVSVLGAAFKGPADHVTFTAVRVRATGCGTETRAYTVDSDTGFDVADVVHFDCGTLGDAGGFPVLIKTASFAFDARGDLLAQDATGGVLAAYKPVSTEPPSTRVPITPALLAGT